MEYLRRFFKKGKFTINYYRKLFEEYDFYYPGYDAIMMYPVFDDTGKQINVEKTRFSEFLESNLSHEVDRSVEKIENGIKNTGDSTPELYLEDEINAIDYFINEFKRHLGKTSKDSELNIIIKSAISLRNQILKRYPGITSKFIGKLNKTSFYLIWNGTENDLRKFYSLTNNKIFEADYQQLKDLLIYENRDPSFNVNGK